MGIVTFANLDPLLKGGVIKYPAVIDGERGAYGVVIPDMPGACCAMGDTVDEALAHAEESLADFVHVLEENGRAVPVPSVAEDVELQPGEMIAYVRLAGKRLVTVSDAAAELDLSHARVRQLCLAGLIVGARKVGRDWMIPSPVVRYALPRGRRPMAIHPGEPGDTP